MKYRISVIFILILGILFTAGCGNILASQTKAYTSITDIDKVLSLQKYKISTAINTAYIYVIVYDNDGYTVKELSVNNNDKCSIEIQQGKKFVVSLYANRTIAYTWNIKNSISDNAIKFINKKWIELPQKATAIGDSADRQNFYFQTVGKNTQSLEFQYERSDSSPTQDTFKITLNVNVL